MSLGMRVEKQVMVGGAGFGWQLAVGVIQNKLGLDAAHAPLLQALM